MSEMEITLYSSPEFTVHGQFHAEYPNELFIHCNVHEWDIKIYRKMLFTWEVILDELRSRGCLQVNSIIPKKDTKTRRFQTMFGLSPLQETKDYVKYSLPL